MAASSFFAEFGVAAILLVAVLYMIFGKANPECKYQKAFGFTVMIRGRGSAVIPKKVLMYSFSVAIVSFIVSFVLRAYGY